MREKQPDSNPFWKGRALISNLPGFGDEDLTVSQSSKFSFGCWDFWSFGMICVEWSSRNSIFSNSILPSEEWCFSFLAAIQVSVHHFPAYFDCHSFLFSLTGIFSSQIEFVASQTGHVLPTSLHLCVLFPTLGMPFPQPPWAHAVPNSGWQLSGQTGMVRKQQKTESDWI